MTKSEYPYPQYKHAEDFDLLLYLKGFITKNVGRYPLATRRQRAVLLGEYRNQKTGGREQIRKRSKNLREVTRQFTQQQKDMTVNVEGIGSLSSRYVILSLDKQSEKKAKPKSLIFLIPGISNDIEGSGMLGQYLALEGHQIIVLSYPESWHGKVTDQFAIAVEENENFEPHTHFFQQMISQITALEKLDPANTQNGLEIWGYSTGAVIAAKLLKEEKFKQHVKRAVLCCPAACTDKPIRQNLGLSGLRDYLKTILDFRNFPHMNPSLTTTVKKTDQERTLMLKVHMALRKQALKKYSWWKDISLDQGQIFMVSATQDKITQSKSVLQEIRESNPDIIIREVEGSHAVALTRPEKILKAINQDS